MPTKGGICALFFRASLLLLTAVALSDTPCATWGPHRACQCSSTPGMQHQHCILHAIRMQPITPVFTCKKPFYLELFLKVSAESYVQGTAPGRRFCFHNCNDRRAAISFRKRTTATWAFRLLLPFPLSLTSTLLLSPLFRSLQKCQSEKKEERHSPLFSKGRRSACTRDPGQKLTAQCEKRTFRA